MPGRGRYRLTDKQVKAVSCPQDKTTFTVSDGGGLYLVVYRHGGTKSWKFNYKDRDTRKSENIGLGGYPGISLADARKKSDELRGYLKQGLNPKAEWSGQKSEQVERRRNTFEAVAGDWLNIKERAVAPKTFNDIRNSLLNHVFPRIGATPITRINAKQVIQALEPLGEAGKTELIRKLAERLNEVMRYAKNRGLIEVNPIDDIRDALPGHKREHRPAIDPGELPQLMTDLYETPMNQKTRNLVLFQLHTMTRPVEAAGALWSEIDFRENVWTVPVERMKKKRLHKVPLADPVLTILERQQQQQREQSIDTDFIFPGRGNQKPLHRETVNKRLQKMGYKGRQCGHGLRSIGATWMAEQCFHHEAVMACLSHFNGNLTTRAYNRATYFDERAKYMAKWSAFINECRIQALGE